MTSYRPLISVVIPTFNRGHLIEKAINSVLKQTYSNLELLIVDDASTDNTEDIVKCIDDNRVSYIKLEENTKGTKPRNVGISLSKGDFITFLDSDDEWLLNKLEKQLKFIEDSRLNNSPILCFTGIILKKGQKEIRYENKPYKIDEDIMEYILVKDNIVQTSTFMVSSSVAKETLFNPELKKHQDWDFCIRLINNGVKFLQFPEHLTVWNVDSSNDRLSNSYKNEEISNQWLITNKKELSKKSQRAFKVVILIDNLLIRKQVIKAIHITITAFFTKSITFKTSLKSFAKIFVPNKVLKIIKEYI